jgi:hypothetical protein
MGVKSTAMKMMIAQRMIAKGGGDNKKTLTSTCSCNAQRGANFILPAASYVEHAHVPHEETIVPHLCSKTGCS